MVVGLQAVPDTWARCRSRISERADFRLEISPFFVNSPRCDRRVKVLPCGRRSCRRTAAVFLPTSNLFRSPPGFAVVVFRGKRTSRKLYFRIRRPEKKSREILRHRLRTIGVYPATRDLQSEICRRRLRRKGALRTGLTGRKLPCLQASVVMVGQPHPLSTFFCANAWGVGAGAEKGSGTNSAKHPSGHLAIGS